MEESITETTETVTTEGSAAGGAGGGRRLRTLIKMMAAMRVIPQTRPRHSADVQPEAILVKNIIVEMHNSMSVLTDLVRYLRRHDYNGLGNWEDRLEPELVDLLMLLASQLGEIERRNAAKGRKSLARTSAVTPSLSQSGSEGAGSYDADTEEDVNAKNSKKQSSKEKNRNKRKPYEDSMAEAAVGTMRDILIELQNDEVLTKALKFILTPFVGGARRSELQRSLDKIHHSTRDKVMLPYHDYEQEVETLCSSIALRQKYSRSVARLEGSLAEIEAERHSNLSQKIREREALQAAAEEIRTGSRDAIGEFKSRVANKMKVLAWSSHSRQSKAMAHVFELKRELDSSMEEHAVAETGMRHANLKLESEVKVMIDKYDKEMFQRHKTLEEMRDEYSAERVELAVILEDLAVIEVEKGAILEENEIAHRRKMEEQLMCIRRVVAAKVIQKTWKAYKTRRLLKAKRRKKRKKRL